MAQDTTDGPSLVHSDLWLLDEGEVEAFVTRFKRRPSMVQQREETGRIYCNRSLSMSKIKAIGFDMDYTLVDYKSPEYETLGYTLLVQRLIEVGYPKEIADIHYDPLFAIRGLVFDTLYGNLIKVDGFGNILEVFHGFTCLSASAIRQVYPNKYTPPSETRYHILNTLFEVPETFALSALVNFFDNHKDYTSVPTGVESGSLLISYKSMQQDVRRAMDWIHVEGQLKMKTLENLDKYVEKEEKLPQMLDQLRKSKFTVFLATNSNYSYTNKLLTYMFDFPDTQGRSWKSYFDYIFVDSQKPKFFQEGTTLREVDEETGTLKLGQISIKQGLEKMKVYAGGSSALLCQYVGMSGKNILYVGDHIFGDIIKSKKKQAMRTFLVIPELKKEVQHWQDTKEYYHHLQKLETILSEAHFHRTPSRKDGCSVEGLPEIAQLQSAIKIVSRNMEKCRFATLGSLLRSGPRQTFFANQATRFADLYSANCISLLHYPPDFHFIATHSLMPHESHNLETGLRRTPSSLEIRGSSVTPADFAEDEDDNSKEEHSDDDSEADS